jgi:hypothetical protein
VDSIQRRTLCGINELDIENLKAGRVTDVCLLEAFKRYVRHFQVDYGETRIDEWTVSENMHLVPHGFGFICEELNDMLRIGRQLAEEEAGEG